MRTLRTLLYALLIVGVAAPAYAQDLNILGAANMKRRTQEEVDAEKQRNDDYKAAMKKLPEQNVKSDPWGSMRGTGGGQPGQKNAAQRRASPKQTSQDHAEQKQKQTGGQ
jgi:hypothetical protein